MNIRTILSRLLEWLGFGEKSYRVQRVEEVPDTPRTFVVYAIGDSDAWLAALVCPCGCGHHVAFAAIRMPEMGGMEATAAVREREAAEGGAHPQRIVAMTALVMTGDRERCLQAGMDDYISKPFRPEDLHAVHERSLENKRVSFAGGTVSKISGTRRIVADVSHMSAQRGTLDTKDLMSRVGDDAELLEELSAILADDAPVKLRALREAFAVHDTAAFHATAHSLKGALAVLGARRAPMSHRWDLKRVSRQRLRFQWRRASSSWMQTSPGEAPGR